MAEIVFAIATSHGPQLHTPAEEWGQRVIADKRQNHFYREKVYSFDELVELRKPEHLEKEVTLEAWQAKLKRNQDAIEAMREAYEKAKPDVAVIFGNDQHEMFFPDNQPAVAVYAGETIVNAPLSDEDKATLPPGIAIAEPGHAPDKPLTHPGHPELAKKIITDLSSADVDVSMSTIQPRGQRSSGGISHAFGFIYRNIMSDNVIPNVPIIFNTFWQPNQPKAKRCYEIGQLVRKSIENWESDAKVAVFGSGGMTHFIIDEDFDKLVMKSLEKGDATELLKTPEAIYQSGTSELKTWIGLAGCIAGSDMKPHVIDYVPCYRSEAGSGTAQGFMYWN